VQKEVKKRKKKNTKLKGKKRKMKRLMGRGSVFWDKNGGGERRKCRRVRPRGGKAAEKKKNVDEGGGVNSTKVGKKSDVANGKRVWLC